MTKIAIVGCGRHMRNTLAGYLQRLGRLEFQVCVDLLEDAACDMKEIIKAKKCTSTLETIESKSIDAAIIAVPPAEAYEITKFFLSNSIPCFVEKPPAPTSEKIRELVQIARERDVFVQVGFNFRSANAIKTLSSKYASLDQMNCVLLMDFRSQHPSGPEWEISDSVEAWMRHNGIHALDLARFLLGDAARVQASIIRDMEERFIIVVHTSHINGSVSLLRLGNLTGYFDICVDLLTQQGDHLYMPNLNNVILKSNKGNWAESPIYTTRNLDDGWGIAGYGNELAYFSDNYASPSKAVPSLLDAEKASLFCDAIIASLQSGSPRMV